MAAKQTESTDDIKKDLNSEQLRKFDILWSRHPKKTSRGDAMKAFKTLNPSDEFFKKINLCHEDQCRYWKAEGKEKKFIKALGPWIRQMCWEDEIGSFSELKNERKEEFCACGKPAVARGESGFMCPWCFSQKHSDLSELRDGFRKNGLGKKPEETQEEWRKRLIAIAKQKARFIGSMTKFSQQPSDNSGKP